MMLIDFHRFWWVDVHRRSLIFIISKSVYCFSQVPTNSGRWIFKTWHVPKTRPAAPIKTFARFQVGILASEDAHRILWFFMDFLWFALIAKDVHGFSVIFIDFYMFSYLHWLLWISMNSRAWILKHGTSLRPDRPAALIETFAWFQAGFMSSEDVHRIS